MAQALPLDEEEGVRFDYHPGAGPAAPEEGVSVRDYDIGVMNVAPHMVSRGLAGAAQWVTGGGSDSWAGRWGQFAEEGIRANTELMSKPAQRAMSASFLPSEGADVWDEDVSAGHAIGLTVATNLPGLVASLLPGAAAARIATALGAGARAAATTATATATGSAGVQVAGDIAGAIYDDVMDSSDEELQKENEMYRGFRALGMSEEDARGKLIESQQGALPLIGAALTAFTSRYGVEGIFKRGLGRSLARGAVGRTTTGALGEGGTEFIEEGAADLLKQYGVHEGREGGLDIDWYEALQSGLKGMAGGAPIGGAAGALGGGGRDARADVPADINAALAGSPAAPAAASGPATTPAVTPNEQADAILGGVATVSPDQVQEPVPGQVIEAAPGAAAPAPVVTEPGRTIVVQGMGVIDPDIALATQTDTGYDPDLVETLPPQPPPSPTTHALTAQDPTRDVQGRPLPAPAEPVPVMEAVAPAPVVPEPAPPAQAVPPVAEPAVPPVTPEVTGRPVPIGPALEEAGLTTPAKITPTPEEKAAYEAAINARVPPKPTGRVLEDTAAQEAEAAEAARKAKLARPGPRMTKQKKARAEAGLPVMTKQEARKYDRAEKRKKIVEQTKAALGATPLDVAKMTTPKAIRAYINELIEKIPDYKQAKTSKFTDEDDPHLMLLAMARGLRLSSDMDRLGDFIRTDFALRQGVDIVSEYRKSQAKKSAPTVIEEMGDVTPQGEGAAVQPMVVEESEPEPTPEEDAARERAEFERKMAARRAESEAAQAAAAAAPKREVKTATTGRKAADLSERLRQKRLEKERAEREALEKRLAREPRSKFAAPTEAKAAEVIAEQIAQDPPSELPVIRALVDLTPVDEVPNPPSISTMQAANPGRFTVEQLKVTQNAIFEAKEAIQWDELMGGGKYPRSAPRRVSFKEALKDPRTQQFTGAIQVGLARFLRMRMRELIPDVPVTFVDYPTMVKIFTDFARKGQAGGVGIPRGFYFNGEIVIRNDLAPEDMTHTFLHEGSHAYFSSSFRERPELVEHINGLMETVRQYYAREANGGPIEYPAEVRYAMTDPEEFLSEAHSNKDFQKTLKSIPSMEADRALSAQFNYGDNPGLLSVWDKLKIILGKLLGGPFSRNPNLMEEVLKVTQAFDAGIDEDASIRVALGGSPIAPLGPASDKVQAAKNYIADAGGSLNAMRKGLALQTLDQIRQRYKGLFQTAKGDGIEIVQTALQKAARTGDEVARPAMAIAEEFRRISRDSTEGAKVAELVIQLTTLGVNVGPGANNDHLKARKVRNRQALSAIPRLQAAFDNLKPESQKWITEAGTFYRNVENNYREEVLRQILSTHPKNFAPSTYSAIINAVMDGKLTEEHRGMLDDDNMFKSLRDLEGFKRIKGYYFPLKRFGDYVVNTYDKVEGIGSGKIREDLSDDYSKVVEWTAATDKEAQDAYNAFADSTELNITSVGKVWRDMAGNEISGTDAKSVPHTVSYRVRVYTQGTEFFPSQLEAKRFIRERGGEFDRVTDVMDKADLYSNQGLNNQQLSAILKSVQRSDVDDSTKRLMEGVLRDAAIRLMPGSRVQKHKLSRVGAAGASRDLGRVTISYAQTAGAYLGKVKHMPEIREALQAMRETVKGTEDKQRPLRGQILNELHARVDEGTLDKGHPIKTVQRVMALSFMDKLASPAYSIINAMQVMMVTMPVLSARHGTLKTNAEIWRAYRAIGALGATGQGLANIGTAARQVKQLTIDTRDIVGSMRAKLGKEKDGEFLQKVLDYANERTPLMDAGMELAGGITAGGNFFDMGVAKVDRIFRQASLAVEAINRASTLVAAARLGRLSMDEDAAIKYAFDTMQNTQGDYTPVNTPRAFKNPWASPFLQFKRYAQMMSMLMYDMTKDAISPSTPRKERVRALKQIAGFVSVQIAMAGALGLPGMELLKVGAMAAAALGLGDGWEEWERYLQDVAKESMGAEFGEMLTRGVMSRGLGMLFGGHGIDLSSRLSLADMWTGFEEPKGQTKEDYFAYIGSMLFGAPGSLVVDWLTAINDISTGDYAKGIEKFIPVKVVADFAKAARNYGDPTVSIPITLPEAALQTVGFRSGRMANEGEKIGRKIATDKELERDKKELNNLWMGATTKAQELKAQVRIAEHNKRVDKIHGKSGRGAQLKVHVKGLNKAKADREERRVQVQGY